MTLSANSKSVLGGLAVITLMVSIAPFIYSPVQAQIETKTVFSSADLFSTPGFNSSIRFATNGSYIAATLTNGVWSFTNLTVGSSGATSNISISAKNCDMTIQSVSIFNSTTWRVSLRYTVSGRGTQSVRFLDIPMQTKSPEWSVIVPSASGGMVWLSEGQNWDLLPNNVITVYGIEGSVSVSRYVFGGADFDSSLPFTMRHSVAIITFAVLIAVVTAGLAIRLARRRK